MNVWPILAATYTFSAGFPIHSLDSASFHFAFSRTRSLDTYPLLQFGWKVIYVMNLSKVPSLCFIDRRHKCWYNHFYGACRSLRNFKSTPRVAYLGSNGRLRTHIVVGRLFGEGGFGFSLLVEWGRWADGREKRLFEEIPKTQGPFRCY